MKRLFAIVLLSLHLFNTGGYTLIFQYFIHASEVQIVKQIYENKIDATQLVQLKIPVHMPGIKDWADYEHLQGQVQLKDNYYQYVGVKMTSDTMYLVCVANSTKTKLENVNLIVAKNVSDVPLTKKGHDAPVKKASVGFECSIQFPQYNFPAFKSDALQRANPIATELTHPYIKSPGKPPNHIG